MPRNFSDWLPAFLDYCSIGEAPKHMYFWTGISTIAGAIRRKVWLEMGHFKWYPNFYIILVAPPGVVSKSTTAGIGMNLLRKVPGIKFGPDVVTWQSLCTQFAESTEAFEYNELYYPMSPMTLEASEFGNLFNPQDRDMVDLFVSLWDGKEGAFKKVTKFNGSDEIQNPWINLIACTTPSWIAGNFPEYMIGGGFTSRCMFVYAEEKEKLVAYPGLNMPKDFASQADRLIQDLEHISLTLTGPMTLTPDALKWGMEWYQTHHKTKHDLDEARFGGYLARKQTHIHKTAMILSLSEGDSLKITAEHLALADVMVSALEADMKKVFEQIGRTPEAEVIDIAIRLVQARGSVSWPELYRSVHLQFPKIQDFEAVLAGAVRAQYLRFESRGSLLYVLPGSAITEKSRGTSPPAS